MKIDELGLSDSAKEKLEIFLANTNLSNEDQSELFTIIDQIIEEFS